MSQNKLTKFLVFLMFFIYITDTVLGEMLYWHYTTWWFDIVMHFLGGFWVGLFFVWFFRIKDTSLYSILKLLAFVLVFGALWEFFQIYANNYVGKEAIDLQDISIDMLCDFAGGLFAISFLKRRIMKPAVNKVQS